MLDAKWCVYGPEKCIRLKERVVNAECYTLEFSRILNTVCPEKLELKGYDLHYVD